MKSVCLRSKQLSTTKGAHSDTEIAYANLNGNDKLGYVKDIALTKNLIYKKKKN